MTELGDELRQLRREHRINAQDDLAELSGVSATTIKKIEAGAIKETRPSTLRLLARGIAKDFDGHADEQRVEAIYTRLMRSAGFLPPERPAQAPAGAISRDAFIKEMERRIGQPLAVAMSTVAWDYDEIPEAHRKILEAAILGLAGAHKRDENE